MIFAGLFLLAEKAKTIVIGLLHSRPINIRQPIVGQALAKYFENLPN